MSKRIFEVIERIPGAVRKKEARRHRAARSRKASTGAMMAVVSPAATMPSALVRRGATFAAIIAGRPCISEGKVLIALPPAASGRLANDGVVLFANIQTFDRDARPVNAEWMTREALSFAVDHGHIRLASDDTLMAVS